jgi:hypothetical protein
MPAAYTCPIGGLLILQRQVKSLLNMRTRLRLKVAVYTPNSEKAIKSNFGFKDGYYYERQYKRLIEIKLMQK